MKVLAVMVMMHCAASAAAQHASAPTQSWPPPLEPHHVPTEVFIDRAGFPELVIQNSVLGLVGGLSLGRALFDDSSLRVQALTLLGLGAGVITPIVVLHGKPVHATQAQLYNFGERWGLVTGLLVPALWNERDERVYYGSVFGFFATGLGVSILLEPKLALTPGQVSALGSGHMLGALAGGLLLMMFNVVPDSRRATAASALFFANAGLAATYLLRPRFDIDRRRVLWTDLGALSGAALGLGAGFLITGGEDVAHKPQLYSGAMLLGMVGGALLGYFAGEGEDSYKRGVDLSRLRKTHEVSARGVRLDVPSLELLPPRTPTSSPGVGVRLLQGRF